MSIREKLRAATLGKAPREETYTLTIDGEQLAIEIREMTFGAKMALFGGEWDGEQPEDAPQDDTAKVYDLTDNDRGLMMMIASCYVAGTDELVYEASDLALLKGAVGTWLTDLMQLTSKVNGVESDEAKDVEASDAPKNADGAGDTGALLN